LNKSLKNHLFLFIFVALIGIFLNACSDDAVTPTTPATTFDCFTDTNLPGSGKIRGTIDFYDTNRIYTGGYYDVSAYSSWPPMGPPSASATVSLNKVNNAYKGCYELTGLNSGVYVIVAAWIKTPYAPGSVYVSGIHGCDTNTACFFVNPTRDTLTSSGLKNINFKADLDTSKMQMRF
jgi:hypothetical protein